jgi:pyrroloquinoline-quinone synthase
MKVRQMLLENLIEEENGPDNHPALWKRFAKALGVAETEIDNHKYLQTTKDSINILKEVSGRKNPAEGLAALYAYESQIPAVAKTKIEGLQQYYNIDSEDGTIFFRVHEEADVIHSQVTREALLRLCTTDEQREIALDAAREACDANNLILDGIYETYCRSEESCMA